MTDFIPPYPKRHAKIPGPIDLIKSINDDLLAIWPEGAFERAFISFKIFKKSIFVANHPDAVKYVLVSNQANYSNKVSLVTKALSPLIGDSLFISDGEFWQNHRALLMPLFTAERMGQYSQSIIGVIEQRLQQWQSLPSPRPIAMFPEMLSLSMQTLWQIVFGKPLTAKQFELLNGYFAHYYQIAGQIDLNSFFGLPSWLSGNKSSKLEQAAQTIQAIFDDHIAEAEKNPQANSLVADFLALKNAAKLTSNTEIRHELIGLFMAGYETAANSLAWSWYLLSQSPVVEQSLFNEVNAVLGKIPTSIDTVDSLAYTRAVIQESMRLYPSMPLLLRETKADDVIRDKPIPAGSIMLVVPWLLHRHKKHWDKPDHFMPERFLITTEKAPNPFTYIPFGAGPRTCIGKQLAMVQTTLTLGILAKHFRAVCPAGTRLEHECRLTLRPKGDLPMQLIAR